VEKIDVAYRVLATPVSFGDTFRALASEVVDVFNVPESGSPGSQGPFHQQFGPAVKRQQTVP